MAAKDMSETWNQMLEEMNMDSSASSKLTSPGETQSTTGETATKATLTAYKLDDPQLVPGPSSDQKGGSPSKAKHECPDSKSGPSAKSQKREKTGKVSASARNFDDMFSEDEDSFLWMDESDCEESPIKARTFCTCGGKLVKPALTMASHTASKLMKDTEGLLQCRLCQGYWITTRRCAAPVRLIDRDPPLQCLRCLKMCRTAIAMVLHIRSVHMLKKPHRCDACGKPYGQCWQLEQHEKLVHDTAGVEPIKCPDCTEEFMHMSQLTKHIGRKHIKRPNRNRRQLSPCRVQKRQLTKDG